MAWLPAAVLAAWALCRALGLERGYPLVPLLAFTPYAAGAGVLVTAVLAALRRWPPAALAAVATALLGAAVAPRAVSDEPPATGGRTLRILSANVFYGKVPTGTLVRLVRRHRPDVLALQELTPELVTRLDRAGIGRLLPHRVLAARPGADGTGLYATRRLRRRPRPAGMLFAMAAARLPGGGEVVSVHTPPPTRPHVERWQRELERLPPAAPGRILAGDFNATLDHAAFRRLVATGYADAAEQRGTGLRATWRRDRRWPPGVQIDHVLAGPGWQVRRFEVLEQPGSDHRAVLAEIVRAPAA